MGRNLIDRSVRVGYGASSMELVHHGMTIVLDDDWCAEAGMADFAPAAPTYAVDPLAFSGRLIFAVKIDDIPPVRRAPGVGIFNDDFDSGEPRHVSAFCGFCAALGLATSSRLSRL